jgi:hypothetical protein
MAALFISPVVRAINANGATLSGAKWYFYETTSLDAAPIYTSSALSTEHPNPVVADSGGLFEPIYLDTGITYRAILKTSAGITIQDVDPYNSEAAAQTYLVHGQFLGTPAAQDYMSGHMFPDDVTVSFLENFNGNFWLYCATPPADDFAMDVRKDGVSFGTITIDDAGTAAVVTTAETFTGGRITFRAPDEATALEDVFWTIRGTVVEAGE